MALRDYLKIVPTASEISYSGSRNLNYSAKVVTQQQSFTLPHVLNKFLLARGNPSVPLTKRSTSTDPTIQYFNMTKNKAESALSTIPTSDIPSLHHSNISLDQSYTPFMAAAKKMVLENTKPIDYFATKFENKVTLDSSVKVQYNPVFRPPTNSTQLHTSVVGPAQKQISNKPVNGRSVSISPPSMYVKLPALSYPINDIASKKLKIDVIGQDNKSCVYADQRNQATAINAGQTKPRMIKDFAFLSKAGQSAPGKDKINQDCAVLEANFGAYGNSHFFAIADGHGRFGDKVSFFVKVAFPSKALLY